MESMRPLLFVRALTDEERTQLAAGLGSSEAVELRRVMRLSRFKTLANKHQTTIQRM